MRHLINNKRAALYSLCMVLWYDLCVSVCSRATSSFLFSFLSFSIFLTSHQPCWINTHRHRPTDQQKEQRVFIRFYLLLSILIIIIYPIIFLLYLLFALFYLITCTAVISLFNFFSFMHCVYVVCIQCCKSQPVRQPITTVMATTKAIQFGFMFVSEIERTIFYSIDVLCCIV